MTEELVSTPKAGLDFAGLSSQIEDRLIGLGPLVDRLMIGLLTGGFISARARPIPPTN